ncbi:hypothetical protein [Terrisporobacter petrolearius]|uniref:hypothetical protein n=1 Tax=Terrisporobacter petrolearius TaxID=1460447 RepID=UPI003B00B0A5
MQNKNSIMTTFFIATIGGMLILCGLIFLIYCFSYEIKHKKKLYKEAKIVAVIGIVIGILMVSLTLLYSNNFI